MCRDTGSMRFDAANGESADSSVRRWKRFSLVLKVMLVGWIVAVAVFFGFNRGGSKTDPVLPDTKEQFSLDLKVTGALDHPVVYGVEQRARPAYRIFSFDPSTGAVETIFSVPTDAIIFGIALNRDRSTLAVSYSPDFNIGGSGIWTLDVATKQFTEITPAAAGIYLADPVWSDDQVAVLTTYVDRTGASEKLSIARIALTDGTPDVLVADAINPAPVGTDLYYLTLDVNKARRSIGRLDATGASTEIPVGDGQFDLDHLMATPSGELWVAVLNLAEKSTITVGTPAGAHGSHDVPSTWWNVQLGGTPSAAQGATDATLVYDASASASGVVEATLTGLSIVSDSKRTDLIASRAIRFAAG